MFVLLFGLMELRKHRVWATEACHLVVNLQVKPMIEGLLGDLLGSKEIEHRSGVDAG